MKRLVLGALFFSLTASANAFDEVSRTEFTYDRYTGTIAKKQTGSWVAFLTKEEEQALKTGRAYMCVIEYRRGYGVDPRTGQQVALIGQGAVTRYCR